MGVEVQRDARSLGCRSTLTPMTMSTQAWQQALRAGPGGMSRSTRARRYPSDTADAEWAVCEPLLPAPAWLAGRGGRPAAYCMRDIVDAIRYLTHNGPVWRALPADFPPPGTVYWQAAKWEADGSTARMHDDLRERVRLAAGRKAAPTAAIIDSQSVKGSEMISRARRGYDAGKKINGTKRHIAVDTIGLLLMVVITAASVQDRDAAKPLLQNLRRAFPQITLAWADGGYAGKLVSWAKTVGNPPTPNHPRLAAYLINEQGGAARKASGQRADRRSRSGS
jgi:transposase